MPTKKPFNYKIGKNEIESDESNKHMIRLAYINTFMYWLHRIIIVLTSGTTAAFLIKVLERG